MPDAADLALVFVHAWGAYLAIGLLVLLDAVLPVVPAEAAVLAGAALVARGQLRLVPLLVATAAGAFAGDLASYRAGRLLGVSRHSRLRPGLARGVGWLRRRGGVVLIAARFVPGGRTASTLAAGMVRLPARRVAVCAAVGGTLWSAYLIGVGYAGGRLLDVPPLVLAVALALAIAGLTAGAGVLVRRTGRGPSTRTTGCPPPPRPAPRPGPVRPPGTRWQHRWRSDPTRRYASGTGVPTAGPPRCGG